MVANGLVTSGVLVPRLQFILRGFMARTTTDEALPFKSLLIIAHILTLCIATLAMAMGAGYIAAGTLVSKAYRCQGSGCPMATGGGQVALVHQYSAEKQH